MDYKITIIIPVFNVEGYLSKTIDSIISQTFGFENIEVILIDDKSTDNSANIINEYAKEYDNIKAICLEENSGFPGKPRNIGLENATAPYIMFLDSDDYYESTACERLYETIIKEDADIVSGSYTDENKKGERKLNKWAWAAILTSPDLDKKTREKISQEMISDSDFKFVVTDLNENPTILGNANVWTKIFKKSLIEDNSITYPEDIVAQDSVFLLESFYCAQKIVFITDVIVHYNNFRNKKENKSISHVKSKNNLYGRIRAYDMMNDLSKKYSKEELFYKYLLCSKINYWYRKYLLKTPISAYEIEEIFRRYSYLFDKCNRTNNDDLPESTMEVFEEIRDGNYALAAQIAKSEQNKKKPKDKSSKKSSASKSESYLKKIRRRLKI